MGSCVAVGKGRSGEQGSLERLVRLVRSAPSPGECRTVTVDSSCLRKRTSKGASAADRAGRPNCQSMGWQHASVAESACCSRTSAGNEKATRKVLSFDERRWSRRTKTSEGAEVSWRDPVPRVGLGPSAQGERRRARGKNRTKRVEACAKALWAHNLSKTEHWWVQQPGLGTSTLSLQPGPAGLK